MSGWHSSALCCAGFASLLIGFLCGAPLGRAINRGALERERAWRVAHSSLVGGGVMLLAIAPCLGFLDLPAWLLSSSVAALCASVASFACAVVVGAASGRRGTERGSGALSAAVFAANLAGVALSLGAAAALFLGAAAHLASFAR